MKRVILILSLFLIVSGVQAQDDAIVKFFSKYMDDDRFSRVYISPKMMQMAGGFLKSNDVKTDKEAADLGELITKIRGIRILTAEKINGKPLYDEAMSTLTKNKYEELMDIQDKASSVKFMVREEGGRVRELLMLTGSAENFTLLSMLGNFTYEDLNILADKTNIPGMEKYKGGK